MIGLVNIPNDEATEFYASNQRLLRIFAGLEPSSSKHDSDVPAMVLSLPTPTTEEPPKITEIFNRPSTNKNHNIAYLSDGRKVFDGQPIEHNSASKLWEQLIVRTFVHKMEDEVQNPTMQLAAIQEELPKWSSKEKALSKSTFSLVSHDRIKSQCNKCCPNKLHSLMRHCKTSKSTCKLSDRASEILTTHKHHHHQHKDSTASKLSV